MLIETMKNTVILGDCLDVMRSMPDKCIDLVLTDPPYGIGFDCENESMSCGMRKDGSQRVYNKWSNPRPVGYNKKDWDNEKPSKEIFMEIFRVSKRQIIFGGNYFELPPSGSWIVWDKQVVMPTLSKCELAWVSWGGHIEIFRYLWAGFRKEKPEERFHPTQKPADLITMILQKYSEPSEIVFDPFAGSGTTAIACLETGRNYILVEKEPEYVDIINKRIVTWKEQLRLFTEVTI